MGPQRYMYIWTDAAGRFRSKMRFIAGPATTWNYDGSSTGQATTEDSEIRLTPLCSYADRTDAYPVTYVLCGTYRGSVPTAQNTAHALMDLDSLSSLESSRLRMAFEQEFFVYDAKTGAPYRATEWAGKEQGEFYCSVGAGGNGFIEPLVREVFDRAASLGVCVTGYNLEVAPAQGEIQVDNYGIRAAHDLMMLRYLLWDTLGRHGLYPVFDPKPLGAVWNGSGLHTNVSTSVTMGPSGSVEIQRILDKLAAIHTLWMPSLGDGNAARLTGHHETSSMERFTWGTGSRAASVRLPTDASAGYFEDRRPAANADPYVILRLYMELLKD
jgi:glutamine synthetase